MNKFRKIPKTLYLVFTLALGQAPLQEEFLEKDASETSEDNYEQIQKRLEEGLKVLLQEHSVFLKDFQGKQIKFCVSRDVGELFKMMLNKPAGERFLMLIINMGTIVSDTIFKLSGVEIQVDHSFMIPIPFTQTKIIGIKSAALYVNQLKEGELDGARETYDNIVKDSERFNDLINKIFIEAIEIVSSYLAQDGKNDDD